jgi:hypothetical protein
MAVNAMEGPAATLRGSVGRVESVQVCPGHREPMRPLAAVEAQVGRGLLGDAHNKARGSRQVLLMDMETLDAFGLSAGIIKENITTRGLAVNTLPPGQRLQIGEEVVLEVVKPCEPCFRMDEIRPGLQEALVGQRGMLAQVITGGLIQQGDPIMLL